MKITGSSLAMVSNHVKEDKLTTVEELKVWMDPPAQASSSDTVRFSEQAKSILEERDEKMAALDPEEAIKNDPKLLIIKQLVEALTGKKITLWKKPDESGNPRDAIIDTRSKGGAPEQSNRVGWGVRYEYHETYSEKEQTAFAATGIIKTADGKEITFNLNLAMSREFVQSTDISIRAGDALLDPLVINFAGSAAELTDQKFAFDLNSDGVDEQMPFVAGGSGILVFDRNGDQIANNGSELFGPRTGNGFNELSAVDQTKDGWIDENDSIYNQLYIWTKDEAGGDHLQSLKQSGVGAIAVPAAETSFDLKNQENKLEGRIKRTGIYLSENGQAGTVQQIDVAI
jgi:hypothetical protein